jgi:sugar lactone lactonase YvrE
MVSYMNCATVVIDHIEHPESKLRGIPPVMRKTAESLSNPARRSIAGKPSAMRPMSRWGGIFVLAAILFALTSAQAQTLFGPQNVGSPSVAQAVAVTAQVAGQVSSVEVLTLGVSNLDFAAASAGSTCASANLSPNQTCTESVIFTPTAPGVRNGAVLLLDSGGNVLGSAYLAGTGLGGLGVFLPGQMLTVAGNGQFKGVLDGGQATNANLDLPSGITADGAGNLYIADSAHHRIRKVTAAGIISTIAGNGDPSYTGDNGPADLATLDTPSGITIDGAGNLYIADTGNNAVRKITAATGIITTVAGNGTAGYNGDSLPATAAELNAPLGVTLDNGGNLYIADTHNHRIRLVTVATGLISTVAGNGATDPVAGGGTFSGDGGPAVLAGLYSPETVAFDTVGNMYIPDSGNNRVREVSASTQNISTFAGTGAGGYNGDGIAATTAKLYDPSGLALDPAGNLYIADTANNRIRKVSSADGTITTFAGNGNGLYFVGSGAATVAQIYSPIGLWFDQKGNLYISDYFDQRIREVQDNFFEVRLTGSLAVGQTSPAEPATIENDGNAALDFTAFNPDANSAVDAASTTCPLGSPFVAVNNDCIVAVELVPTVAGNPLTAFVHVLGDTPNSPLAIQIGGVVVPAAGSTTTTVSSSLNPSNVGQNVTFTATVTTGTGTGDLTGTVSFSDGTTVLAAAVPISSGVAAFTTSALTAGSHSITASYSGDSGHSSSTSTPPYVQVVNQVFSPTVTAVSSSLNPSTFGQGVTFTAQVSTVAGTGSLTGTVTFSDGANVLAPAMPLAAGVATFATSTLAVGSHSITASYSGDSGHSASTSTPPLVQMVYPAGTTGGFDLSVTPATLSLASSQSATVTATLSSRNGFTDTIGLGCASLPAAVTCHFSNISDALKAGAVDKVLLTINTNNPLSGGTTNSANSHTDGQARYLAGMFFPFAGVFGWLLWKRRRRHVMLFQAGLLFMLVSSAVLLVTGCGGFTQNSAAPGTYVIQVVAVGASSNITQSQSVTLTITK